MNNSDFQLRDRDLFVLRSYNKWFKEFPSIKAFKVLDILKYECRNDVFLQSLIRRSWFYDSLKYLVNYGLMQKRPNHSYCLTDLGRDVVQNQRKEICIATPQGKHKKRMELEQTKIQATTKREKKAKKYFSNTLIERKLQYALIKLGIDFIPNLFINSIKHSYPVDIFIPSLNLVIEADGNYWHHYPFGLEIDRIRTKELITNGFNVLRLWQKDIDVMSVQDLKDKLIEIATETNKILVMKNEN